MNGFYAKILQEEGSNEFYEKTAPGTNSKKTQSMPDVEGVNTRRNDVGLFKFFDPTPSSRVVWIS